MVYIMELIPELFLFLLIFVNLSSGVKFSQSANEICILAEGNPSYGTTTSGSLPVKTDEAECSIKLRGNTSTIVQKAVKEAKDYDAQVKSGASTARQHLAHKALTAAKAAEEVLAAKLLVEDQLESELRAGLLVVQKERKLLQTTKTIAAAARLEAKQSRDQVEALTEAVKNAQEYVADWALVVSEAQQQVTESRQIVDAAKKRFELLRRKVEMARADFQNTKEAAEKAACAAQEARLRQAEMQAEAEAELSQETVHIPKLPLVLLKNYD